MDSERATRRLTGEDRTAAFSLLAHVYQATAAAMAKLRQVDVAWVAGDRSIEAAERAGEPLLAAAGVFRIAHAFLSGNRIEEALRDGACSRRCARTPGSHRTARADRPEGALNQVGAVIATRANEEDIGAHAQGGGSGGTTRGGSQRLRDRIRSYERCAACRRRRCGAGDAGEALRRAAPVDASRLSVERRGRFLLDMARAYAQRRKTAEAVRTIEEAEALTPEQVRSHPMVREMVRDLLRGRGAE